LALASSPDSAAEKEIKRHHSTISNFIEIKKGQDHTSCPLIFKKILQEALNPESSNSSENQKNN
jgi:hypothetical protein